MMWCIIRLVEHEEKKREELVQSILSYVGLASFLTYSDDDGSVAYAIWFADHYLDYVIGLHAARPDLGGVEIIPSNTPSVLRNCSIVWEMEMRGYGAAPLPEETGIRSATAALGTQITDIAYRLLICHRVERSELINEYVASDGHPTSIYRKVAGMAAREALDFISTTPKTTTKGKPSVKAKKPPYTNTRIILGANKEDHLKILVDSFPAGSLRRLSIMQPGIVPTQATIPPKVRASMIHFPVFNDAELGRLELIPTNVTEVPMKYGRAITSTTQPPMPFVDLVHHVVHTAKPAPKVLYMEGDDDIMDDYPPEDDHPVQTSNNAYPIQMIDGRQEFPMTVLPADGDTSSE